MTGLPSLVNITRMRGLSTVILLILLISRWRGDHHGPTPCSIACLAPWNSRALADWWGTERNPSTVCKSHQFIILYIWQIKGDFKLYFIRLTRQLGCQEPLGMLTWLLKNWLQKNYTYKWYIWMTVHMDDRPYGQMSIWTIHNDGCMDTVSYMNNQHRMIDH